MPKAQVHKAQVWALLVNHLCKYPLGPPRLGTGLRHLSLSVYHLLTVILAYLLDMYHTGEVLGCQGKSPTTDCTDCR